MPTRNIDLTDHLDRLVEESISSGHYENASEVVRDGLRLLQQRQQEDAAKLERLGDAARIGFDALDRGDYVEVDDQGLRELIAVLGNEASKRVKVAAGRS